MGRAKQQPRSDTKLGPSARLPAPSWVTLGRVLRFSKPQFPLWLKNLPGEVPRIKFKKS